MCKCLCLFRDLISKRGKHEIGKLLNVKVQTKTKKDSDVGM